jgi:hypothetical protein
MTWLKPDKVNDAQWSGTVSPASESINPGYPDERIYPAPTPRYFYSPSIRVPTLQG